MQNIPLPCPALICFNQFMSRLFQFFVIMMFAFAGEAMAVFVPLPIAGPIWGLVLLFAALSSGIVPLKWVDKAADFMLGFLGLFFIAPAVGVIEIFESIRPIWPLLALILVLTYLASMISTGFIADIFLRQRKK